MIGHDVALVSGKVKQAGDDALGIPAGAVGDGAALHGGQIHQVPVSQRVRGKRRRTVRSCAPWQRWWRRRFLPGRNHGQPWLVCPWSGWTGSSSWVFCTQPVPYGQLPFKIGLKMVEAAGVESSHGFSWWCVMVTLCPANRTLGARSSDLRFWSFWNENAGSCKFFVPLCPVTDSRWAADSNPAACLVLNRFSAPRTIESHRGGGGCPFGRGNLGVTHSSEGCFSQMGEGIGASSGARAFRMNGYLLRTNCTERREAV